MPSAYPLHLRTIQRASKSRSQPASFRLAEPTRGYGYAQASGTDNPVAWDISFRFLADEAIVFWLWFTQVIEGGAVAFTMPIRTEDGTITHTCKLDPDTPMESTEDGQTWVYRARILARQQVAV